MRRLASSSLKRLLRWISRCIWTCWKTSWFSGLMQHAEKVELFSSRMEPRPTQLIASRSGVRETCLGSGRSMASLISRSESLDFAIWSILKIKAWSSNHLNIGALKNRLKAFWDEISEETVRTSCSQVPDRLRRVVKESKRRIYWKMKYLQHFLGF